MTESLVLVCREPREELLEVSAGELPLERLRHQFVAGLEGEDVGGEVIQRVCSGRRGQIDLDQRVGSIGGLPSNRSCNSRETGMFDSPLRSSGNPHIFDYAGSRSVPFLASWGSVHAARLKQQGLRFPLFIFDMLTSTRRLRVSGFLVASTQRTHSQRAIGVMSFHRSWIF